jgi:hypothetical protein
VVEPSVAVLAVHDPGLGRMQTQPNLRQLCTLRALAGFQGWFGWSATRHQPPITSVSHRLFAPIPQLTALCNILRKLKRFTARQLFKLLERYDQPGIEVLRAA